MSSNASNVAVEFDHVSKTYRLYKSDRARLLSIFFHNIPYQEVHANNDLSFTVNKGESVAFLGGNGAGKSTLLKMITKVVTPSSGTVTVNGRVSALLELSAGFDMHLTGRENLKMRGHLWGLSAEETKEMIPKIVEFAEIGQYIDQPMRTYSSGMRARLGFAFASSINPEILIIDEALSVGDRKFSKKCLDRVHEIMSNSGVTVLFVTHSLSQAKQFCKRGIVVDKGQILFDGEINDSVAFYEGMS